MSREEHWEKVYRSRPADQLGWFRPRLETSTDWIRDLEIGAEAALIDIGGGASTLVDGLLAQGWKRVTVLDISQAAIDIAAERLGSASGDVTWIHADITDVTLPRDEFDVWHDRAAFHFLVEAADRVAYLETMSRALKPGGCAILGVFAPEAPERCSGLPVKRYDVDGLADTLGKDFRLERHRKELHVTPGGTEQMYLYAQFRYQPG